MGYVTTRFVARKYVAPTCKVRILSRVDSSPRRAYRYSTYFNSSPRRTYWLATSTVLNPVLTGTTAWSSVLTLRSSLEAPNVPWGYCQLSHVLHQIILPSASALRPEYGVAPVLSKARQAKVVPQFSNHVFAHIYDSALNTADSVSPCFAYQSEGFCSSI